VVAGSPEAHRQAILFAKQAQRHRPIKVFHKQHDARRWLNSFGIHGRLQTVAQDLQNAIEARA